MAVRATAMPFFLFAVLFAELFVVPVAPAYFSLLFRRIIPDPLVLCSQPVFKIFFCILLCIDIGKFFRIQIFAQLQHADMSLGRAQEICVEHINFFILSCIRLSDGRDVVDIVNHRLEIIFISTVVAAKPGAVQGNDLFCFFFLPPLCGFCLHIIITIYRCLQATTFTFHPLSLPALPW